MAKKPAKAVTPGVNVGLLQTINQASVAGGTYFVSQADGKPLADAGLIEVNTTMLDAAGNAAARLTDAGRAMISGGGEAAAEVKSPFEVITGAVLPEAKRGNRAGAPTQYPFDQLAVGQSFFVPVSEKHSDPVKTLGSTVSSANQRYAEPTGEKKTVTRTKRGPGNKGLKDAAGNKITETVTVDVMKFNRKFSIRKVEAGKEYGAWKAPADGALIARVS